MKYLVSLMLVFVVTVNLVAQEIAFTLSEKDLIPEGITVDPATGDFYISSIFKNKIVKISKGKATDFIQSNQDGFMSGVGLHVDSRRNILWACSGAINGNSVRGGVHAYDLGSGKVLSKWVFPAGDTTKSFFNDLVIDKDGIIYMTNTFGHSIWKWGLSMESPAALDLGPVKLNLDGAVKFPNGIAISPDDRFLFVATSDGLKRVNLNDNSVELIPMPQGPVVSSGLDGIEFYNNSILGVQNDHDKNSDMKIVRYYLAGDYEKIERVEVLDAGDKYFDVPTTLVIVNNELYVLANSQLRNLDFQNFTIKQPEKLGSTFVLKYTLSK